MTLEGWTSDLLDATFTNPFTGQPGGPMPPVGGPVLFPGGPGAPGEQGPPLPPVLPGPGGPGGVMPPGVPLYKLAVSFENVEPDPRLEGIQIKLNQAVPESAIKLKVLTGTGEVVKVMHKTLDISKSKIIKTTEISVVCDYRS